MITRIRRAIAVALAILLTVLTLGRLRLDWTGRHAAAPGAGDPGQAPSAERYEGSGR